MGILILFANSAALLFRAASVNFSPLHFGIGCMDPHKKRLMWILVLIFFFFANLIVGAILIINGISHKK